MKTPNNILSIIFSLTILFTAFTSSAIEPKEKGKSKTEKKVEATESKRQTDYLNLILPKAITDITSGKMTYVKDANGIYRLVPEKGC